MGKRRLQVSSSDSDDDGEPTRPDPEASAGDAKRQKSPPAAAAAAEEEEEVATAAGGDEVEEALEDAKPVGDVIRVSGKGKKKKRHYASFEYDGNVYELEDPVLLTPEDHRLQKPYVAIIKDIVQGSDGNVMVTGQWFYRPEEATRKGGGNWQSKDARELFYSFHLDDVPAESVMHKCVVHYVPLHKQLPVRSQNPGFIVQKIYDAMEMKLWKLTDKNFENDKYHEIDLLVQKTKERLGELPDIVKNAPVNHDDSLKKKWNLRNKTTPSVHTSRGDAIKDPDHSNKAEIAGFNENDVSEYHRILLELKALTGYGYRDKWLEKLLQGIQSFCDLKEDKIMENKDKTSNAGGSVCWPNTVVSVISALEKASYETLGSDFQKYNQKMRQLVFNLKNNALLAKRLLNKELDPVVIITMSPNELKDGLTSEEKTMEEPEMPLQIQMTDARCSRCAEKKVAVTDIIQTGARGDRYQLECTRCGYTWFSSRDAISSLTVVDVPSAAANVGTAPLATAKFEDVEKTLASPRESEKPAAGILQKSTAAYIPVLETQKSLHKTHI